jgi:hypothetical protein
MTAKHLCGRNRFASLSLVALLTGCGMSISDIRVSIDPSTVVPMANQRPRRAQVSVTDIRREVTMERSTLGGMSMGRITLVPPAQDIIKAMIETKADDVLASGGIAEPQTVLCGIRRFDIATPATLFRWDVNAKIELVLRVRGQDRTVSGQATEHVAWWPSEEIIARVTAEALRQVAVETEGALTELFAAVR